ncbi:MAG TPA: 2-phosphosulfolactate phosphatase [bacterium]|nr:2-phosphosulfolactate phosphatase [bacterium]
MASVRPQENSGATVRQKPGRRISVHRLPADFAPERYRGANAVVIDALRATSTVITALHHGCREVHPVFEVEEALSLKSRFAAGEVLLGGERHGFRITGFDLGNSPLEYTREKVAGKHLILTTTNGTRAMRQTGLAHRTLLLAFLNLEAVAARLQKEPLDLHILCSGRNGDRSLEDEVCAGMLIDLLTANAAAARGWTLDEPARETLGLARTHRDDLLAMMQASPHGRFLAENGFGADLTVCARLNRIPIVPELQDGTIRLI